ncbi:Pyrimidine-specific ribonucleoside hydrolase [Novosphingobium nitrogenifigens DSM 19370]|uniref:Pyrimidine-specific ribonucleoside hydrolase n=1 Tax=Novosphingobium nitrogenifigens DSM 19370 TaxID=983920 RepID=F1Z4G4_9SPHN|nr:nucleoside hydrolase [Novosphingobium nitrogenifigens]EGD60574.1 Pyrimidine-specific ribonucleoside hydrolase [Novosphingobium nitrogenifigens DSM 19370]
MPPLPIIIDCDPGQDDAINLLLAFASPEAVRVLAVTTVAGNVPVELTQRNARLVCELAEREDVPVHAGCARPLMVSPLTAEHVHGDTGIDGLPVHEPAMPLQPLHAVDFLVETLLATDEPITLVATGPLTNLALALARDPGIARGIERIVLMGGAMREAGNITPCAEFNMRADPHAADMVLRSGVPIVMLGLDVTHELLVTRTRLARMKAIGNPVARAAHDMLAFSERYDLAKYGKDGAPLHDPCTMAWLLRPDLFRTRACHVAIETGSPLTLGHSVVDFWNVEAGPRHVQWAHEVDAEGFFDLLFERLARFSVVSCAVTG